MVKTVLITGANKGIGFETARQLGLKQFRVIIAARDAALGEKAVAELKKNNMDAHLLQLDVTSDASVAAAAKEVEEKYKTLDVLINNAGALTRTTTPENQSLTELQKMLDVNVIGVVRVTNHFLPLVKKSSSGRVVVVSSILGSLNSHQDPKTSIYGQVASIGYSMSKAAINMFVVNLAHTLRDTHVKVNAGHPGWVQTDMGGSSAPLTVEQGAKTSVFLATLPDDGPTGGYFFGEERLPW